LKAIIIYHPENIFNFDLYVTLAEMSFCSFGCLIVCSSRNFITMNKSEFFRTYRICLIRPFE